MFLKNRLRCTYIWWPSALVCFLTLAFYPDYPTYAQDYDKLTEVELSHRDSGTAHETDTPPSENTTNVRPPAAQDILTNRLEELPLEFSFPYEQTPSSLQAGTSLPQNLADSYRKALKRGKLKGRRLSELDPADIKEMHELYQLGQIEILKSRLELSNSLISEYPNLANDPDALDFEVEKQFAAKVRRDVVKVHVENIGRAEVNSFEGPNEETFYVIRVVHERTQYSILYSDYSQYVQKLDQFKKWVGRQLHEAQRDTLHVMTAGDNPDSIDTIDAYGRASTIFSMYYWANWARAIWKAPSKQDIVFVGAICTAADVVLMACMDQGMSYLQVGPPVTLMAYINKLPWGFVIGGLLQRTLQNWVEMKGRLSNKYVSAAGAWLKRYTVSFLYGVSMVGLTSDKGFASLDPTTPDGRLGITFIVGNLVVSTLFKDQAQELAVADSKIGLNAGSLKIPLVGTEWEGGKKQIQVAGLRIITGLVRYVDLRLKDAVDAIPLLPTWANVVLSRGAYLSLTLVPMYLNYSIYQRRYDAAVANYIKNPSPENHEWMLKVGEQRDRLQGRFYSVINRLYSVLKTFTPTGARQNFGHFFSAVKATFSKVFSRRDSGNDETSDPEISFSAETDCEGTLNGNSARK